VTPAAVLIVFSSYRGLIGSADAENVTKSSASKKLFITSKFCYFFYIFDFH